MSLQHRHIIFWLLSVGVFVLAVLVWHYISPINAPQAAKEPLHVTTSFKVPTGRYYQTNGRYALDMSGTTQLILPLQKHSEHLTEYDFLVIQALDSNQPINLFLTAQLFDKNQKPMAFKQPLINHGQSINKLNETWQTANSISDVALVIESEINLGFGADFDVEASWKSIQFTDSAHINPREHLMSVLLAFIPLDYTSINRYSNQIRNGFKTVILGLGVWITIIGITFLVIKPPVIHLISGIALAWLLMAGVYGYNFEQQITFNKQRFAKKQTHLNRIDEELWTIAEQIDKTIQSHSNQAKKSKVMILGGDNFKNKRLNYHLLQYNVAILGQLDDIENMSQNVTNYAVLLPPRSDSCQPDSQSLTAFDPVIILKTAQFCLLQL